jgi:hypothetical protein
LHLRDPDLGITLPKTHHLGYTPRWAGGKTPTTVLEIWSFVGLAGYYRRFIEGFSRIVKPLTSLLEKEKKFIWSETCQNSFDELRKRMTTAPVLVMPDIYKSVDIYCDASKQGLGCVLMQEGHLIAYASR